LTAFGFVLPQKKPNYGSVELLRVVAILGVIWFHIPGLPGRRVAFTGLIVFVILTAAFSAISAVNSTFSQFAIKRSRRLLIPWIIWSVVYAAINKALGRPLWPHANDYFSGILAGPWIGLWYLPFALIVSLLAYPVQRAFKLVSEPVRFYSCIGCGLVLLFLAGIIRRELALTPPWGQWLHALPAAAFGYALSLLITDKAARWNVFLFICIPLIYATASRFEDMGLSLTYVLAMPLTALAFMVKVNPPSIVTSLGALGFGVYVLHGGLISVMGRIPPFNSSPYWVFALTTIAAFSAASLFKRIPLLRNSL
jgi:fucose 4-O-acetylase-like acetyltransferase